MINHINTRKTREIIKSSGLRILRKKAKKAEKESKYGEKTAFWSHSRLILKKLKIRLARGSFV